MQRLRHMSSKLKRRRGVPPPFLYSWVGGFKRPPGWGSPLRRVIPSFLSLLIFFFLFSLSLHQSGAAEVYDIDYYIVDKTKTPWGHKFYRTYQEIWEAPKGIKGYFIIIGERKVSFRQSWVYVKVGDNIFNYEVYTSLLKPTMGEMDMQSKALEAVKKTLSFLLRNYFRLKSLEKEL